MKRFRLGDAELARLQCKRCFNPVDPRYAPMQLYLVSDLEARAHAAAARGARGAHENCAATSHPRGRPR